MTPVQAGAHTRENGSVTAAAEKRLLISIARRLPMAVTSDHLSALGLVSMAIAGLSFAAMGWRPGVADEAKGEVVWAWVVCRAGQSVSEADLRAYCRQQLAPYKVPARVEFRSELPKTMVGKVLRRALRDSATSGSPGI